MSRCRRLLAPLLMALAAMLADASAARAETASFGAFDPLAQASALQQQGLLADRAGDYLAAERALLQANALFDQRGTDAQRSSIKTNLCNLYEHMGDYERADPFCEDAVIIAERAFGPRDPRVAAVITNYAQVCRELGRIGHAELLYSRALDIYGSLGPTTREIRKRSTASAASTSPVVTSRAPSRSS